MACDDVGGIGFNGSMPWPHIDGDLARFKTLTHGSTVIMGRGTWESTDIPKPLPGRTNVVVTHSDIDVPNGVWLTSTIAHLSEWENSWIIGGAGLFHSVIEQIGEVYLTRIPGNYNCDTCINLVLLTDKFILSSAEQFNDHSLEIWVRK